MQYRPPGHPDTSQLINERIQPAIERFRGERIQGDLLLGLEGLPPERLVALAELLESYPKGTGWLQALVSVAHAVNAHPGQGER